MEIDITAFLDENKEGNFSVGIDAALLLKLAQALGADKEKAIVRLTFNTENNLAPIKVDKVSADRFGLIMPTRFE